MGEDSCLLLWHPVVRVTGLWSDPSQVELGLKKMTPLSRVIAVVSLDAAPLLVEDDSNSAVNE